VLTAEILMAGSTAKSFLPPEKLSDAIANFNAELCSETFLRELQGVLPNDDDVGYMRSPRSLLTKTSAASF
jgi:cytokinesis protein